MSNVFRRVWSNFIASRTAGPSILEQRFKVGLADFDLPAGWQAEKKSEYVFVARSSDGQQQATISLFRFETEISFDGFKELCRRRLKIERQQLADGVLEFDPPVEDGESFSGCFSGGDKQNGRLFSGYLSAIERELIVIYVEAFGIAHSEHLNAFYGLVGGLKRKMKSATGTPRDSLT